MLPQEASLLLLRLLDRRGLNRWVQHALAPLIQTGMQHTLMHRDLSQLHYATSATQLGNQETQAALQQMATQLEDTSNFGYRKLVGQRKDIRGPAVQLRPMDGFSAAFYQNIYAQESTDPQAKDKQAGAVMGFVELIQRGLAAGQPLQNDTSKQSDPAKASSSSMQVAFSEESSRMPVDYIARSEMYRAAFRTVARLHNLQVGPFRQSQPSRGVASRQDMQKAATALNVLLRGMEATPGLKSDTLFYNLLIGALAQSGNMGAAEALYQRMAAGHKGAAALPDPESAEQLFNGFARTNDIAGMWRVLQTVADSQHIRKEYAQAFPQLVSRLGGRLLGSATSARNWDVAQAVLRLINQLKGQEVTVVLDAHKLIRCIATAAQYDQWELCQHVWRMLQASPEVPIEEGACCCVLEAAARASDVEAASQTAIQVFTRLKQSISQQQHPSRLTDSQTTTTSSTASGPKQPWWCHPSPSTYQAYIHVLSRAQEWEKAFTAAAELESIHAAQNPSAASALEGLAPLAEALALNPKAIAAGYDVLVRRQVSGQSVTTSLMNVVLRAMALGGSVEQAGRLFEEYPAAGLTHDAVSYNAVIESCVVSRQPVKAASILKFMQGQGLQPDSHSYDLLLRSYLAAEDVEGAKETLLELRKAAGVMARLGTMQKAKQLAKDMLDREAEKLFASEVDFLLHQATADDDVPNREHRPSYNRFKNKSQ